MIDHFEVQLTKVNRHPSIHTLLLDGFGRTLEVAIENAMIQDEDTEDWQDEEYVVTEIRVIKGARY